MEKTRIAPSDNYYRVLFDAGNDAMLVLDPKTGAVLDANQKFTEMFGYSSEQWETLSLSNIVCNENPEFTNYLTNGLQSLREARKFLCQAASKSHTNTWIEAQLKPIQIAQQNYILAILQDVGEYKHIESNLLDSEKHWRAVVENVPDFIVVVDRQGTIQFVNKVMAGREKSDILGKTTFDFQPPEFHEPMRRCLQQVFTTGNIATLETVAAGSPGDLRHFFIRFCPMEENHQIVAALLIATDETEQKIVRDALHQSEEKFKKAFYASPDVIGITRMSDGKILEVNDSFEHVTGYSKPEAIGHTLVDLNIYAEPQERQLLIDKLRATNRVKDFPWTLRTKSGELRDCLISSEIFAMGEQAHLVSVIRDITDTKKAETALRESEASLRKAHEIANIGNWSWDLQTNHVHWSDNLYRIYGFDKDTLPGPVWDIIFQTIHPDDKNKLEKTLNNISVQHTPKWRMDYRIIRPDGELRYLWGDGEYLYDNQGNPEKVIGIVQDVTERELARQALEQSRAELKQSNLSLAAINTIADRVFRTFDEQSAAKEAVTAIAEYSKSPSISFHIVDPEHSRLTLAYTTEKNQAMVNRMRELPIEGSISGRAIRENTVFGIEDLRQDNRLLPKARDAALQQGYMSAVCIPVSFQDEVLAVINFAYQESRTLSPAELDTYLSIGKSIGVALANARHISRLEIEMHERQQAEETLRNIAIGVSAATGGEFFRSLVSNVADTFSLDYAFLGELDESTKDKIKTIAFCMKGAMEDNFEYDLKYTPCENVITKHPCIIADSVQQQYPKDLMLRDMGIVSYVGTPLRNSKGSVIGLFVAMHSKPLSNAQLIMSTLQIFAVRAAAELERLEGEVALRSSEEHLRLALNASNVGTWDWDIASGKVTWSQNIEKIFKLAPGAFKGGYDDYFDLIHPQDTTHVQTAIDEALKGLRPYSVEHRIKNNSHTGQGECWMYCQGEVQRDTTGKPIRMLGTISDISERKNAELEIKASQKMLQLVLDSIPSRVYWKDLDFKYLGCNKLFAEDAGIQSVQQIIGKTDYDMAWREHADHYRADDQKVMRSGVPKLRNEETQIRNGKTVWLETSKLPLTDLNGNIMGLLGTYTDISVRKQALEDKRRSDQRLMLHFKQTPLAVVEWNTEMEIVEWNRAAERIFGYSRDEAIGRQVVDLIIPQESRNQVNRVADALIHTQGGDRNTNKNITKDGRTIICEWYNTPLVDDSGHVIGVASAAMDITERINTEHELAQYREHLEELVTQRTDELTRVNKELEAFSYSVSHDLRAPLRSIDGFSQILLEDYIDKLDEQGKDYLHRVRNGAQRMAQLIDDMLKLSRLTRSSLNCETVNLSEISNEIVAAMQKESPRRDVEVHITPNMLAYGDEGLLIVVLDNLISNAWKYTSKKPHAIIEIGGFSDDKETTYWVKDNGAGFNMKYVDKLFGAFQRLHPVQEFEGSGIGLATVARIIHSHGGSVWAEGEENQGATFYFALPNSHSD
jgi:PAS domain S-box-containing protein